MTTTLCHSADFGDIIASLPCLRALGGGDIVIGPHFHNQGRETLKGDRFDALRPLLEAQPYVGKVEWQDEPRGFSHDLRMFREGGQHAESLLSWQARHLGLTVSEDPWLAAVRSPLSLGRTVIARSLRYQNPGFPWNAVLAKHRKPLFVGTKEEHEAFLRTAGYAEYCPTKDLLELAQVIGGASLFVGNQSCPFWIAAGLGVAIIQETWERDPNSQIRRANTRYLMRGPFTI